VRSLKFIRHADKNGSSCTRITAHH
jgi:hypothetical protein